VALLQGAKQIPPNGKMSSHSTSAAPIRLKEFGTLL